MPDSTITPNAIIEPGAADAFIEPVPEATINPDQIIEPNINTLSVPDQQVFMEPDLSKGNKPNAETKFERKSNINIEPDTLTEPDLNGDKKVHPMTGHEKKLLGIQANLEEESEPKPLLVIKPERLLKLRWVR